MGTKASGEQKRELYLRVSEERSHGYFHVEVRVCEQRYEQGAGNVPHGVDDGYDSGPKYSDLRIRCQGDERSQLQPAGSTEAVYGWDVTYDASHMDARMCRRMGKTFDLIERGLRKLEETRGRARTFPEYVGRVAEVLKCKGMAHAREERQRTYNPAKWEWTGIGDGVREISNRIWRWQREAQERQERLDKACATDESAAS